MNFIGNMTWLDLLNVCTLMTAGCGSAVLAWLHFRYKAASSPWWAGVKDAGMVVFIFRYAGAYSLAHYYGPVPTSGVQSVLQGDWLIALTCAFVIIPIFGCIYTVGVRLRVIRDQNLRLPQKVEGDGLDGKSTDSGYS